MLPLASRLEVKHEVEDQTYVKYQRLNFRLEVSFYGESKNPKKVFDIL